MARIGVRLSVRTLIELVAMAAIGLGFWRLAEQSRPPGPAVRALKLGDEGERVAALRALSLMGDEAAEAFPALVVAAREDPSPAVRRGSAYAMMRIAIADPKSAAEFPIDSVLAGPAPPPPPGTTTPNPGGGTTTTRPAPTPRPFPLLHPRAGEAATNLADVMRVAPDPSVRLYALRCLRKVLDVAMQERISPGARRKPGQPKPSHPAAEGWVEATAQAIADRARDPDPEVAGHAIGFLAASRGKDVLSVDERIAALLVAVDREAGAGAKALPAAVELMALNVAAKLMTPDHPERSRLIELVLGRLEDPPDATWTHTRFNFTEERKAAGTRAGYVQVAWQLVESVDELRERPELAEVLVAALSADGDEKEPVPGVWAANGLYYDSNTPMAADRYEERANGRSASYSGGFPGLTFAHDTALGVIVRDPRLLGEIWPRLDRRTRHWWQADHLAFSHGAPRGGWDRILSLLSVASVRPDLPPEQCGAVLTRLLKEPGPVADEKMLGQLAQRLQRDRGDRPGLPSSGAIEDARQVVELRSLAVMTFFARGTEAGGEGVARLVDRLRGMLGSGVVSTRSWAASLLGTLGGAARPAIPELEAMVEGESDEATRDAAEVALEAIRGAGESSNRGASR